MKHLCLPVLFSLFCNQLFSDNILPHSLDVLVEGKGFTEGPLWLPEKNGVLFSQPKESRLWIWREGHGAEVYREDSGGGNGNVLDREGRLITCEGKRKRVTREEKDGSYTVLAESFDGQPLNNPNDVAVGRDGSVYFSDPNFGMGKEGEDRQFLYRVTPEGVVEKAWPASFDKPNGVAISPDGKTLYLNEGSANRVLAFDLDAAGRVQGPVRVLASELDRALDGIAVQPETGNLFIAVFSNREKKPDMQGLQVYTPQGKHLGYIPLPGNTTNVCFTGNARYLYATSGGGVFEIMLAARNSEPHQ